MFRLQKIKVSLSIARMAPYLFPHCSISLLSLLGNAEAVYVLLQTGANIFSIDKEDRTVLYWAAMQDHKNVIDVRNLSYIHTLVKNPRIWYRDQYTFPILLHIIIKCGIFKPLQRIEKKGGWKCHSLKIRQIHDLGQSKYKMWIFSRALCRRHIITI